MRSRTLLFLLIASLSAAAHAQSTAFIYQGQIPGLVALPTTAADGVHLATGGAEVRAAVGDIVRFETGDPSGYHEWLQCSGPGANNSEARRPDLGSR